MTNIFRHTMKKFAETLIDKADKEAAKLLYERSGKYRRPKYKNEIKKEN
jgi:hypothetical protein